MLARFEGYGSSNPPLSCAGLWLCGVPEESLPPASNAANIWGAAAPMLVECHNRVRPHAPAGLQDRWLWHDAAR